MSKKHKSIADEKDEFPPYRFIPRAIFYRLVFAVFAGIGAYIGIRYVIPFILTIIFAFFGQITIINASVVAITTFINGLVGKIVAYAIGILVAGTFFVRLLISIITGDVPDE